MFWQYLLVGLVSWGVGFALGYFVGCRKADLRSQGTPVPEGVNCVSRLVWGYMNPNSAAAPDAFHATISPYSGPGSCECPPDLQPPSGSEITTWHWTAGTPPRFTLENVPSTAGTSGQVCVHVWAKYGGTYKPGCAVLGCGTGSGHGGIELLARQAAAQSPQRVTTTVAHKYAVPEPGFASEPLHVFNQAWSLTRRGGACGQVIWDNGGNGTSAPLVELATTGLYGFPWKLTFRCGAIVVTYSIPPDEWRALAANAVRLVTSSGVPADAALPSQLIVHPA
jgi:hypothetical protein